jgi:hypothetical protein
MLHPRLPDFDECCEETVSFTKKEKFNTLENFKTVVLPLNLKLEKIEEILIIPIIGFEWRSLYLYYILNKYKCRIGFFARGMLPIYSINLKRKILSTSRIC